MNKYPNKQGSWLLRSRYLIFGFIQVVVLTIILPIAISRGQLWAALSVLPICFLINLVWFLRQKTMPGVLVFWVLLGISLCTVFLLLPESSMTFWYRLSIGISLFGFCWLGLWYSARSITGRFWWWAFMPGMILLSVGMCFAFSKRGILDIGFYIGGGTGLGLLGWGLGERLLGLMIAGSLTLTTAPGAAFSFQYLQPGTVLTQLGIMLIWFAMGWGLISISSRVVNEKYLWWPLIPAGIFGVVGLGLYFGGDPRIASTLLGNTGAFGVMIFAGYLILFRTKFGK